MAMSNKDRKKLYEQYLAEVASFEKYGTTNVISFEEWLEIKNIKTD